MLPLVALLPDLVESPGSDPSQLGPSWVESRAESEVGGGEQPR